MASEARKDERMLVQLSVTDLQRLLADAVRSANVNDACEYMTLEQVADLVQATTKTVRKWVKSDGLPAMRVGACGKRRKTKRNNGNRPDASTVENTAKARVGANAARRLCSAARSMNSICTNA